jgi:hypothetical protein
VPTREAASGVTQQPPRQGQTGADGLEDDLEIPPFLR